MLQDDRPVRLDATEKWPYPKHEYAIRAIWGVVWATLWQVCWCRLPFLRMLILRLFGAKVALRVRMAHSVQITRPWDLEIGECCTIGPRAHLYNLGGLTIGEQTLISQDAYICGGTHDHTDPTYPLIRKRIVIGRYVWIAAGAFIYPGVTIGEGAVVAARAVVVKDVEPWTVVAGNPAKVIKRRVMQNGRFRQVNPPQG